MLLLALGVSSSSSSSVVAWPAAARSTAASNSKPSRWQPLAAPHDWRTTIDELHGGSSTGAPAAAQDSSLGLNARDFGAMGDGVCTEAPDRSWTKCSGRDDSAALQRAIDASQHQGRTLYVPAGVYMVNTTLIIRKPNENASIAKPQPFVT